MLLLMTLYVRDRAGEMFLCEIRYNKISMKVRAAEHHNSLKHSLWNIEAVVAKPLTNIPQRRSRIGVKNLPFS